MKLLVLCPRFPYPLEKGDKLRIYHQLRQLSKEHEIYLIALTDEDISPNHYKEVENIVSSLKVFTFKTHRRGISLWKSVLSRMPFQVAFYYSSTIRKQVAQIALEFQPDHVYCQLTRMAEYAKRLPFPKTLDYMDAFGVGMERRADVVSFPTSLIYKLEANRMKRYESTIFKHFDHHTVISQQDRLHINTPDQEKIRVVPNGIDTEFFQPMSIQKVFDIGFVGNMGYPPNVDAAEFLIHTLKPILSQNLRYQIAGARPDKRVKLLAGKNVTVTGWIDDVRTAYASCKVFVAPLWSGTGQQNKILEAMAMGIPCVTSSAVNNAIGASHKKEILVADTKEEFKICVDKLLNDPTFYMELSKNALTFVQDKYSWKESVEILNELFESR
ncbi:MAG: glycosyltransferase [Saprospiraceae bacterium]|nr:glycosyltransferase [Saprospiraceae bacterium]